MMVRSQRWGRDEDIAATNLLPPATSCENDAGRPNCQIVEGAAHGRVGTNEQRKRQEAAATDTQIQSERSGESQFAPRCWALRSGSYGRGETGNDRTQASRLLLDSKTVSNALENGVVKAQDKMPTRREALGTVTRVNRVHAFEGAN